MVVSLHIFQRGFVRRKRILIKLFINATVSSLHMAVSLGRAFGDKVMFYLFQFQIFMEFSPEFSSVIGLYGRNLKGKIPFRMKKGQNGCFSVFGVGKMDKLSSGKNINKGSLIFQLPSMINIFDIQFHQFSRCLGNYLFLQGSISRQFLLRTNQSFLFQETINYG